MKQSNTKQKKREELVNSISHGIGLVLAITATVLLIIRSVIYGTALHIVCYSIFGVALINLYTASTLFHSAINVRLKYELNKFDHSSIYVLIAATYTPFSLLAIRGWLGWTILGITWGLAIAGVIFKIWFYSNRYRKLSAWLYVIMGWIGIIAAAPIIRNTPPVSLWLLLSGCLAYSASVVFYLFRKIPYSHGVFHLFIIFGSAFHFLALYFLV